MLNKLYQEYPVIYVSCLFIIFFFGLPIPAPATPHIHQEHKKLTYDMSVSAVIVPLFAVDSSGQPVYDLQEDDLQLLINGKSVAFMLNRYQFEETAPQPPLKPGIPIKPDSVKQERRVVFIILDAIFNNADGFHRGKKIIAQLIEKTKTDDHFIVILMTPTQGLQYVAGPLPVGTELLTKIREIKLKTKLWRHNLFSKKKIPDNITYGTEDPREDPLGRGNFGEMRKLSLKMEKMQYMATVKRFGFLLSQFQYALRTITNPKIVFLVSGGVSRSAFETTNTDGPGDTSSPTEQLQPSWSQNIFDGTFRSSEQYTGLISRFHLQYLEKVSKSINRGGSVLYTINPAQTRSNIDENESGDMSLNFMANRSGGKHFEGSRVENIIKEIKRSTAAYYELTFAAARIRGRTLNLQLNSKRTGVKIHSLRYATKATPYAKMNRVRRKIFALNAVTGGTWSRMSGVIMQSKFRIFKSKSDTSSKRFIRVNIPLKMQNRKVDVFLIESDPKTKKVFIQVKSQVVKQAEQIEVNIKASGTTRQYLALIEPETPYCIFCRIN